jgi:hypothetical protein
MRIGVEIDGSVHPASPDVFPFRLAAKGDLARITPSCAALGKGCCRRGQGVVVRLRPGDSVFQGFDLHGKSLEYWILRFGGV